MGPGLNQLEYEVAILRFQEIASEYRQVQPVPGATQRSLRQMLSSTGRQIKQSLHAVAGIL